MINWLRKVENIMAASAFAEAGEFETVREILQEERKILLALRGDKGDINAFKYALNTCKRIGAELEILYVSKLPKDLLSQFRSTLKKEGIEYRLIKKSGSLENQIRDYTGMKKDILFVVVEVSEGIDIHSKNAGSIISSAWKNLKCPLVVVSKNAVPSMTQ